MGTRQCVRPHTGMKQAVGKCPSLYLYVFGKFRSLNNILVSVGLDETLEVELLWSYRGVFPCPLALVPPGGRGRPRDLQWQDSSGSMLHDRPIKLRLCGCVLYKLKRSQCDLLSTLFQFTPLFIQVAREHLTCQAQRAIVCNSSSLKYL